MSERVRVLGFEAEVARGFFARAKGLIGRRGLPPGKGLLILRCNAIHMFFMRFAIDAIFLDAHDNVVRRVRNVKPWRPFVWGGWRARKVLETASTADVKAAIRAEMRAKRRAVTAAERAAAAEAFAERVMARGDVAAAVAARRPIAVYCATPDEFDTAPFVRAARARGCVLCAPRWNGAAYDMAAWNGDDAALVKGPRGIPEPARDAALVAPSDVAAWLVPGLAFTRAGGRLGYGGGWYDRLLAAADPQAPKIAAAYDFQYVDFIPQEDHDCALTP